MVEADTAFVLDGWLRSYARGPRSARIMDLLGGLVPRLLQLDKVLVACDDEDSDVLHGFAAFSPSERIVDHLYVKGRMRGFGGELIHEATKGWTMPACSTLPLTPPRSGWTYDPESIVRRICRAWVIPAGGLRSPWQYDPHRRWQPHG